MKSTIKCEVCGESYQIQRAPSLGEILRPLCAAHLPPLASRAYPGWTREDYDEAAKATQEAADVDRIDMERTRG